LRISKRAHLILPTHRALDMAYEQAMGKNKIGSTLKGIGPCYTDKTARLGLRFGDILAPDFKQKFEALKQHHLRLLSAYNFSLEENTVDKMSFDAYEKLWLQAVEEFRSFPLIDSELFINKALAEGKSILAEGAQGSLLDVDFGSYPYVTSSNTIAAGVCSGLGVPPSAIGKVIGIFKAYCTRVGSGPFPTELHEETGEELRKQGHEYGSTTGRPRRCGWLDMPALRYAIMLNGVTDLVMMKADVLNTFEGIDICTGYEVNGKVVQDLTYETLSHPVKPLYKTFEGWKQDLSAFSEYNMLPEKLRQYTQFIEADAGLPIKILSVGAGREETIIK